MTAAGQLVLQRTSYASHDRGVSVPGSLPRPTAVIVVGPPLDTVGGMTSVVRQQLAWTPDDFDLTYEPMTLSQGTSETMIARLARHVRHVRRFVAILRGAHQPIVHIHTCSGFSFFRSAVDAFIAKQQGCRVVLLENLAVKV